MFAKAQKRIKVDGMIAQPSEAGTGIGVGIGNCAYLGATLIPIETPRTAIDHNNSAPCPTIVCADNSSESLGRPRAFASRRTPVTLAILS